MIAVAEHDRDVLLLLWVDDVFNKNPQLQAFQFTRAVFSVSSSPLNATFKFHLVRYLGSHLQVVQSYYIPPMSMTLSQVLTLRRTLTLSIFLFLFFTPPPAYHAGAKLGAQAQALPVARRKPSTAQQCFASSQQRSLWPHTAPYPEHPRAQPMQPFLNNGALGRSPTCTKNNPPHPAKHHPFRI